MSTQTINIQNTVNDAIEKALKSRGIANVLIAGKTGVGKSTLVNAVFQGRMAETGQGRPVTQYTRRISKEGIPVSIYDTKGLEIKDYKPILAELLALVKAQNVHVHRVRAEDPSAAVAQSTGCLSALGGPVQAKLLAQAPGPAAAVCGDRLPGLLG